MSEYKIDPKFNIQKVYKKMILINPYINGGSNLDYTNNIISYWNYNALDNGNVIDQVGINDLTTNVSNHSIVNDSVEDKALSNSGVDSPNHFALGSENNFNFGNGSTDLPFSFSTWLKVRTGIEKRFFIMGKRSTNTVTQYQLGYIDGVLIFWVASQGNISNSLRLNHTFSWNNTQFTNVIVTYNGSSQESGLNLYTNGVSVGTKSEVGTYIAMGNYSQKLSLGNIGFAVNFNIDGIMDETAFFDKELSQLEVNDIYNKGLNNQALI